MKAVLLVYANGDKAGEWRRRLDGSKAPPEAPSPLSESFMQV